MSESEIRIGVLGATGRGALAKLAHKPGKGSIVVAGVDIHAENFEKFKGWYDTPVDCYTDYKEMLARDDIDVVFVTSPDFLHEEHAVAALRAGKDIYLEKPMAITIEGCDAILETARETGQKLFVGHNMRYMSLIIKMKEIIDSGAIGEVKQIWCRHFINYGGDAYFKDWHSERKYSNSLLLQKGAHDIDVIHWFANSSSVRVVGMGSLSVYDQCERRGEDEKPDTSWQNDNYPPLAQKGFSPNIDVEDQNMVLMTLANGIQACYLQNHFTPDACRNYCIIGTMGRLENYGNLLKTWTKRIANTNLMDSDETIKVRSGSGSHGGSDQVIVNEFLNYLRNGGETTATPIAARNSVAVGCLAAHSMRNGNIPMDIPSLPAGLS